MVRGDEMFSMTTLNEDWHDCCKTCSDRCVEALPEYRKKLSDANDEALSRLTDRMLGRDF